MRDGNGEDETMFENCAIGTVGDAVPDEEESTLANVATDTVGKSLSAGDDFDDEKNEAEGGLQSKANGEMEHQNIMSVIAGLGMFVNKMDGDGNCLFRSLSDQIYKDGGFNHMTVRHEVCNHLAKNINFFRDFFFDLNTDNNDSEIYEYIGKMRQDKEWGGGTEISAAAKLYSRKIIVFQHDFERDSRITYGEDMTYDANTSEPPPSLMIVYTGGCHYDSVVDESRKQMDRIILAKEREDRKRMTKTMATMVMRPLTRNERDQVVGATSTRGVWPPDEILASHESDYVHRESMQTLGHRKLLNDEVINYYLKICLSKRDVALCERETGRRRSHFFNSFFVQTMFDETNNDPKLRGIYNYKKVESWSKKVPGKDIFQLKYVFCPINLNNTHWTLAVIFMEEKRIQYYDSLGKTDWVKLEGLLDYVKDEYRAKNGKDMDTTDWNLVPCTMNTPKQKNRE
jgi:hypothetical protein